jgi:glycosyltransferase involved in cell wall biosynthesis
MTRDFCEGDFMRAHILLIGGEDHHLRMPFFLALRDLGFRVSIAATAGRAAFEAKGFAFHEFKLNRFWSVSSDLETRKELAALLRRVDADVAHSFDTKISLLLPLAAGRDLRTGVVRTINGRGWVFSSRSPAAMALRVVYLALQRAAAATTDATIFEHSGDQNFFTRAGLIGKSWSVLIPGAGIDVAGFERARRAGPAGADVRRELGLEGAQIVTTVTRVTREKGVIQLLKAADIVARVKPNVRFLVVGPRESEGPFAVPQEEFDRRRDYVLATGMRTDVPALLGVSDVFAFPSEYAEGVPRAIMEAALCALPIVATDIAGCREVIVDGWNGVLTPKRSPEKMAARILGLLDDRATALAMGARGPDLIRGKFALDNVVSRHAEVYQAVADRSRGGRARPGDGRETLAAPASSVATP